MLLRKHIIATILIFSIVFQFGLFNQTIFADELFAGGNGSIETPFLITTCQELQNVDIASAENNYVYKLANDIDCTMTATWNDGAGFKPIGTTASLFSGYFDGNGKTISGLTIDLYNNAMGTGLFSNVVQSIIQNMTLSGGSIKGGDVTGSLAGVTQLSVIGGVTSTGIEIEAFSDSEFPYKAIGGLIGITLGDTGEYPTIQRSSASNTIIGANNEEYPQSIGGLVGIDFGSSILDSYSTTDILGGESVGGLVGVLTNAGIVNESEILGRLRNTYAAGTVTSPGSFGGGLVGLLGGSAAYIASSFSVTPIVPDEETVSVAGIIGSVQGVDVSETGVDSETIYFDATATGFPWCVGLEESLMCTPVNTGLPADETDETYFLGNGTNGPLGDFDFDNIWQIVSGELPTLRPGFDFGFGEGEPFDASDVDGGYEGDVITVTWNTNQPATSQVYYGLTYDYENSTEVTNTGEDMTTEHTVSFPAPLDCRTYYFVAVSVNANDEESEEEGSVQMPGCPPGSFIPPTPDDGSTQEEDNFQVWMSPSEQLDGEYSLVNFDNSMLGWWRFENDGTDDSGVSGTGLWTGIESYTDGQFGAAGDFDGASSFNVAFNNPIDSSFTVSAWVNLDTVTEGAAILSDSGGQILQIGGSSRWQFDNVYGEDSIATTGEWTHLVGVYDASEEVERLFVNGEYVTGGGGSRSIDPSMFIGKRDDDIFIDGRIDDVVVWNRALGEGEIASLYSSSATRYEHEFTDLTLGDHAFKGYFIGADGTKLQTEMRTVRIGEEEAPVVERHSRSSGSSTFSRANALLRTIKKEIPVVPPTVVINPVDIKTIIKDLKFGMTSADVNNLQRFLISENKGQAARMLEANGTTNYFGKLTRAALAEWQKTNGIVPAIGYFGPKTRAAILNK